MHSFYLVNSRRTALRMALTLALGVAGTAAAPGPAEATTVSLSSQVPSSTAAALAPSYPVPGGAVFVATSGSDSNNGTADRPFATLSKALKSVATAGTIVIRGGTYRQGVQDPPTGTNYQPKGTAYNLNVPAGVTVQNYPGETVWFDGTDIATGWTKVTSNHYTKQWSTPTFCGSLYYTRSYASQTSGGPCSHDDAIGGNSSLGDPMMAFRNGTELTEVRTLAQLNASSFYYDQANQTMHLGFDPNTATVELTKRAQALAFYQATNLTIRGIGFRRYASNEFTNATGGAILINGGSGITFERTAISQNAGGGLLVWGSKNLKIRSSALMQNGHSGLRAHGLNGTGNGRDDMLIEYSRLDDNNRDRYSVDCKYSCSPAGAKLTYMVGFTARFSSFSYNRGGRGSGLWCDENCTEGTAYGNQIVGNDRHGLIYEVSNKGILVSNLIANNGFGPKSGYGMMIGSANTRMYNNTVVNNNTSVFIYDDDRRPSAAAGPDAANIEFANNIVSGGTDRNTPQFIVKGGLSSVAGNTRPSAFMKVLDNNSYFRTSTEASRWVQWKESWTATTADNSFYNSLTELQKARGKEYNGQLVVAATNPFLADPAAGDYQAKPTGAARALPSDIAQLLGVGSTPGVRGMVTLGGGTVTSPPAGPVTVPDDPAPTPAPVDAVTDSFQRSANGSWGTASSGQKWTVNSTDGVGVNGNAGYLNAIPGKTRQATLPSVNLAAADTRVAVTLDKLPTAGSGTMVSVLGRAVSAQSSYYAKLVVAPSGRTVLQLQRSNAAGVETVLKSAAAGVTVGAGNTYHIRLQVAGSAPTTLRAKLWLSGTTEPTAWTVSTADTTSALQGSGYVGLRAYQSGSSSNTVTVAFDNFQVVNG